MSQLVTGEAVALDLRRAALPSRVVAAAVDAVLQLVVLAVVGGIATAVSLDVSSALVDALGRGRLSVISVPGASPSVRELEDLGVARVSTGPFPQNVALTALQDAAGDMVAGGVLPPGTRRLN